MKPIPRRSFLTAVGVVGLGGFAPSARAATPGLAELIAEGGRVEVPAGDYSVTSPISVPSDSEVVFDPRARLVVAADIGAALLVEDAENVTIRGGQIDGRKADRTAGSRSRGIYGVRAANLRITGVRILDTEDHGIQLTDCYGYDVEGCEIRGAGKGAASPGGSAIAVSAHGPTSGRIVGNRLADTYRAGVRVASAASARVDLLIEGNTAERCGRNGSGSGVAAQGKGSNAPIWGLRIIGNSFIGCDPNGVRLTAVVDSIVTGNLIDRPVKAALHFQSGTTRIRRKGNVIVA